MSLEFYIESKLFSSTKGFELGSKVLYHNGRLGAEADFYKIKEIVEKCNRGKFKLSIFLKNKYTVVVCKKPDDTQVQPQTEFNLWSRENRPNKITNQSVYLISSGSYQKIGIARCADSRLKQLQTGNPNTLSVVSVYLPNNIDAFDIEQKLHQHFDARRVSGEWFDVNISEELFQSICSEYDKAL